MTGWGRPGPGDRLEAAAAWLRAKHPELPLVLMGFSFGGFVAVSLAGRLEADDVALQHLFMIAPAVMRLSEQFR